MLMWPFLEHQVLCSTLLSASPKCRLCKALSLEMA